MQIKLQHRSLEWKISEEEGRKVLDGLELEDTIAFPSGGRLVMRVCGHTAKSEHAREVVRAEPMKLRWSAPEVELSLDLRILEETLDERTRELGQSRWIEHETDGFMLSVEMFSKKPN